MLAFIKRYITLILIGLYLAYVFAVVFFYKNPHMHEGATNLELIAFHSLGFLVIATAHAKAGYDIYGWYVRRGNKS